MLIINHMTRIYIPRMLESVIVRVITWGVRMGVWRVDPPSMMVRAISEP